MLDRGREHRLFRRLPAARIDQLLSEANGQSEEAAEDESPES